MCWLTPKATTSQINSDERYSISYSYNELNIITFTIRVQVEVLLLLTCSGSEEL